MKMIVESNFDVNIEKDSKKNLYIEGLFALSEKKNENNRIYTKDLLEREIDKMKNGPVSDNSCLGELEHPIDRANTLLERAAIMTDKLEWSGNDVYGRAKVLENVPAGYTLKGLLESGVRIGISSRGLGETKFDESRQAEIVTESYNLLCWDCVQNPSTPGAFVKGILEGVEFNSSDIPKQISYDDVKKLMNENNLIKRIDPMEVKKLLDEGYTPEAIKDKIEWLLEKHYKKIWQVLENI